MSKMKREDVYAVIDTERAYQEKETKNIEILGQILEK